jgi:anti-anti-sigma factor
MQRIKGGRRLFLIGARSGAEGDAMRTTTVVVGQLVQLCGRLDGAGSGPARDALHAALTAGSGRLVVDLAGVDLLDATGLGVLMGTHRRARLAGRQLVLRDASPRVARILRLTRVDRIIETERAAVAA